VDEGFGCMDLDHLNNTKDFFEKLNSKNNYDWMLVVSHIEEMHHITKKRLEIKRNKEGSHITSGVFRDLPEAQRSLVPVDTDTFTLNEVTGKVRCNVCRKELEDDEIKKQKHIQTKTHLDHYVRESALAEALNQTDLELW